MNFNYNSPSIDVNDLLYNAELITNAFAKTLEDNNCLLILTIGLQQNINNGIKDLEDAVNNIDETNDLLDKETEGQKTSEDILDVISDIVDSLKDDCFKCDLKFPDINFDMDLKGLLGDLKFNLELYTSIFKINKLDLCQPAYALQDACVPDILRLITLLLTAFVSIMTLRKLSNISIAAFIKGVLSTLLSKITQALKITVNIGSTNISCLIDTLQEIALAIPTQKNIQDKMSDQENLALGLIDQNGKSTNSNLFKSSALDKLNKTLDSDAGALSNIDKELKLLESNLNESFSVINDVVDASLNEINNYIQSLLGFQTYFECEAKRSGMDVEEAIQMINNLIQVINMLSSLVLSMVKKNIREDACKTPSSINNLSAEDIDDLQIKDIIEDLNQKTVEIIESSDTALEVIIYEKPTETGLPKLDLLDCSIDDFIEAHTLPRIIEVAKKQIREEQKRETIKDKPVSNYTFTKLTGDQKETISNIVDLIYTKPTSDEKEEDIKKDIEIKNPIGLKGLSTILSETIRNDKSQTRLTCKSVEDVLSILNSINK